MATNFTFTSVPDTISPKGFIMTVEDGTEALSEAHFSDLIDMSFKHLYFSGDVVSSAESGTLANDDYRHTIQLNNANFDALAAANISAQEAVCYISGVQAMTIPEGWHKLFTFSSVDSTVTVRLYALATPITSPGGSLVGDCGIWNLNQPQKTGAYFHQATSAGTDQQASTVSFNGTTPAPFVGAREVSKQIASLLP